MPRVLEGRMRTLIEEVEPLTTALVDVNTTVMRRDVASTYLRIIYGYTSRIICSIRLSQALIQVRSTVQCSSKTDDEKI